MSSLPQQMSSEFLSHRDKLAGFILGLTRDPHLAEDIFQEVWLRFLQAMERGEEIREVYPWGRVVARRLVIDHWRKTQNPRVIVDSELAELVEQAFCEQDKEPELWRNRIRALEDCVKNLPNHAKETLRLKYEKGWPVKNVAEATSRTASAVMMVLSRLRQSLAQCVAEKLSNETGPR